MISAFTNTWKIPELRDRILFTMAMIVIVRLGVHLPLPGVNMDVIREYLEILKKDNEEGAGGGVGAILNVFSGGGLTSMGLFALGIMPYISASIIVQLLGIAVPAVQKMQAEGESGRKKINQYTRFLTIAITLVQAPGYLATSVVGVPGAVANPTTFWWFSAVLILVCSTLVIMWLGERITDKGVGNGISLLIMIGIIATFPQALIQEFIHPDTTLFFFLVEVAFLLIVIGALVGSSGAILSYIMCKAMNRPLFNVVFGAFGGGTASSETTDSQGSVREVGPSDLAVQLNYSNKVLIVPGYGLAVAQAQHIIKELEQLLEAKGIEVELKEMGRLNS